MALADILRDAGMTDDQITNSLAAFDPAAMKAVDAATMRQSDYSRAQDDLRKKSDTLQQSWDAAQAEYVKMQQDVTSTKAERDEAAKKLKEAEDRLKTAPAFDADSFRTEFEKKQRDMAAGSIAFNGDVADALDEYQTYYGKRLKAGEFMKEVITSGKSPSEYLEEKYKISEKRSEIAARERQEQDDKIRREEREKVLAEMTNPATRPLAASESPFILNQDDKAIWPEDNASSPAADKLLTELKQKYAA